MKNRHAGTSFDNYLDEQNISNDVADNCEKKFKEFLDKLPKLKITLSKKDLEEIKENIIQNLEYVRGRK